MRLFISSRRLSSWRTSSALALLALCLCGTAQAEAFPAAAGTVPRLLEPPARRAAAPHRVDQAQLIEALRVARTLEPTNPMRGQALADAVEVLQARKEASLSDRRSLIILALAELDAMGKNVQPAAKSRLLRMLAQQKYTDASYRKELLAEADALAKASRTAAR